MAANIEFEDEIRGVEIDYFEFSNRGVSYDDNDGSDSESGTGSDEDGDSDDFSIGTNVHEWSGSEPTAGAPTSGP